MRSEGLLAGESAPVPSSWLTDKRNHVQTLILAISSTFLNVEFSFVEFLTSCSTRTRHIKLMKTVVRWCWQLIHVTAHFAMDFDITSRRGIHTMTLFCSAKADFKASVRSKEVVFEQ